MRANENETEPSDEVVVCNTAVRNDIIITAEEKIVFIAHSTSSWQWQKNTDWGEGLTINQNIYPEDPVRKRPEDAIFAVGDQQFVKCQSNNLSLKVCKRSGMGLAHSGADAETTFHAVSVAQLLSRLNDYSIDLD